MTTKKNLVKQVLMSTLTAATFSFSTAFTACSDDLDLQNAPEAPETELTTQTRAASSNFNINQISVIYGSAQQTAQPFDTKDWQKETAIFCYVDEGGDNNIYRADNKQQLHGFKLVNLPWSSTAAATNIPPRIWKEMMPNPKTGKNTWKLVLMNCGKENVPNGNFLGFYNELTGVLRIFVYVPKTVNAEGNTHMWGLLLNDKMASRSIFRYGVPEDRSITTDNAKAALKQTDEMTQIISPWKRGNFTGFNDTPLNPGWWAFDMDFSTYRNLNNETTFTSLSDNDDVLSVKTLCKKDESLKMESKLLAKLGGTMELEATQASTSSGIFAPLEDLLGKGNEIADLVDLAQNIVNPNPLKAIENGIKLAKGACNLAGIDYGEKTEGFNGYKGNINLNMDGTIDTKGVITNQANVSGMYPISLKKSDFLTENCPTFGEGIWNLKETPVVYYTNAYVTWRYDYDTVRGGDYNGGVTRPSQCRWTNIKSPFGGQKENGKASKDAYQGHVCFFDPNSIKLELNPNLFSQTEIENAKVYAVCGVRNGNKFGSTATYRKALGLSTGEFGINGNIEYPNRSLADAPFDAMSSHKDKANLTMKVGTKFAQEFYDQRNFGIFGRGDSDYIIEPQALHGDGGSDWMPAYEVTVTVVVTKDFTNEKLVYSRTYLPEYKLMNIQNMLDVTNQKMPENYAKDVYDQQMDHIMDIYKWTRRTLLPTNGTDVHFLLRGKYGDDVNPVWVSDKESYPVLFDNDLSNRWVGAWSNLKREYSHKMRYNRNSMSVFDANNTWKGYPCWFVEFKTQFPVSPTSYTLISANDAKKYPQCNPRVFGLWGKKNPKDPWTFLAFSSYNNQPEDMLPKENSMPTGKIPFRFHDAKNFQYFRFEVLDVADENLMRLGEIRFNYDD